MYINRNPFDTIQSMWTKMEKNRMVAIIGAGISRLVACKHQMEKGLSPTVFEARTRTGGVWAHTHKFYYQFTEFPWPSSVSEPALDHDQVIDYVQSYAAHFNLLPRIKFNYRVVGLDCSSPFDEEDMASWDLWGGTGGPFSPAGKWNITVQDSQNPSAEPEVYEADFVILRMGKLSDLPNIPEFPPGKGPEVFKGKVMHSMDYAAMDDNQVFVKGKRTTVIGFHKSALDLAAEVASINGPRHPCTVLFKTVHWMVPEHFLTVNFKSLNRISELMIRKPSQGFFFWLLALLISPLLLIFSKLVNSLKWIYPLKKYNMIPGHGFLRQISSCMFTVLPAKFYKRVEEGSLILQQSEKFNFFEDGLIVDNKNATSLETDLEMFATGYEIDDKIKNIFTSTYFQHLITGSSAPFYRDCIHPRVPQLAILGHSKNPTVLRTVERRSEWLARFLVGEVELPISIEEMEDDDVKSWDKCSRHYSCDGYKRSCATVLLQVYGSNDDQLHCRDLGSNPKRKKWFVSEIFAPYGPLDYANHTRSP